MKRFVSLLLAILMLMTCAAAFTDVPAENAALTAAVNALSERGITKGVSETQFGTENPVTREQMAAFIYRMLHDGKSLEGGENETTFTDLADPTFFAMVSWVSTKGIIKGLSSTTFNPKGGITLQDACTMLTRALGCEKDGALDYPLGYMGAAEKKGLLQNVENTGELTRPLTRGDVAILMHNTLTAYDADIASRHVLDGKKVIFIGNSHTYYGKTVLVKGHSILDQKTRSNDYGYFYQICKNNGAEVAVTNWTFGSHYLSDFTANKCAASGKSCEGENHMSHLKDKDFDYVIFQGNSSESAWTTKNGAKKIMEVFRQANPNVKFIYFVQHYFYMNDNASVVNSIKEIEDMGITVVDWGNLIYDVVQGTAKVEGAKEKYDKNTFVIRKSKADGYHPSMLTGYIASQMLYCALTGESAVGQDYSFCGDKNVNSAFNFDKFIADYYIYDGATTNFPAVFASKSDMTGIQKLIDKYLAEKPYQNR